MSKRAPMRVSTTSNYTMKIIKNAVADQVKRETDKVKAIEKEKCRKAKAKMRKKK